jgi:hypothetical protein
VADIGCGAVDIGHGEEDIDHGEEDNVPKVLHVIGIAKHLDSCHVVLEEQSHLEGKDTDNQWVHHNVVVQPQVHDTEGCRVGLATNPRQT